MRLLDVDTHHFVDIYDPRQQHCEKTVDHYAILSHTWDDGQELSYQDWQLWVQKSPGFKMLESRSGFRKIMDTCLKAKEMGHCYVWIDTICIDKSSSAELSEAINSMFAFYAHAAVCLAFLSDVDEENSATTLKNSKWFTRGWTLQELLAPNSVEFFGRTWKPLGSKHKLSTLISEATGIPNGYLYSRILLCSATIAERMSWAAKRQTTRIEDAAYCLLGIFDINMPLLYGEADKAFLRFQEEILKVSTDHSIFAWSWSPLYPNDVASPLVEYNRSWVTFLAPDIRCFAGAGSIQQDLGPRAQQDVAGDVYTMTNLGLQICLPLIHTSSLRSYALLNVLREGKVEGQEASRVCIPVARIAGKYMRCRWPENPVEFPINVLESLLRYRNTIIFARRAKLPQDLLDAIMVSRLLKEAVHPMTGLRNTYRAPERAFQILFHGPGMYRLELQACTRESVFDHEFSVLETFGSQTTRPSRRSREHFQGALFNLHKTDSETDHVVQVLVGVREKTSRSDQANGLQLRISVDCNANSGTVAKQELVDLVNKIQSWRPNADRIQKLFSRSGPGRETNIAKRLGRNKSASILKHVKTLNWHAAIGVPNDGIGYTNDSSTEHAIKPCPVFIWDEPE